MIPPSIIGLMVIVSCGLGIWICYYSIKFSTQMPGDRKAQPFILPFICSIMTVAFTVKVLVLDCHEGNQMAFTSFSYWLFSALLLLSNLMLVQHCGRSFTCGRREGRRMMDDKIQADSV